MEEKIEHLDLWIKVKKAAHSQSLLQGKRLLMCTTLAHCSHAKTMYTTFFLINNLLYKVNATTIHFYYSL